MKPATVFPRPGYLLRALITSAGYRGYITKLGLDKDLDDLAKESRPGSTCELMQAVEEICRNKIAEDCGAEWAQFLGNEWIGTREALQTLVLNVEASHLADPKASQEVVRLFTVPMLSRFLRLAGRALPGPEDGVWWKSPFRAWVQYASVSANISRECVLERLANRLNVDQRSIERWLAGEPTGKLNWPYRPIVQESVGKDGEEKLGVAGLDRLTGWLMIAVAFQSLPAELRDDVRRDHALRDQQPWSVEDAVAAMNHLRTDLRDNPIAAVAMPLLERVEQLFAERPCDAAGVRKELKKLKSLIDREPADQQRSYRYLYDWFSARLAAVEGEKKDALRLYDEAVAGAWWFGGQNQHPILNEALLYAVGVGKKKEADYYWDKTFLLGLNRGSKRPLDEQEMRRIAFGFEKMFFPQKSKDRIPPPTEFVVRDQPFALTPQHLANPNRKEKFADGRTRRTPFMQAISEGTLGDVKRMLDAGADPDDHIPESGEGPLSYAMRRACDRKDTLIMEHLLSLELRPETVNRPASIARETPLKIAIEMANAKAVERLIALGADIEQACDHTASALCYAMAMLYASIHRRDGSLEREYFEGKNPADAYDAKVGAVLDTDLKVRRSSLVALLYSSPRHRMIFDAVKDYFLRPAEDYREVIRVLLSHGANPNRRYKVQSHGVDEWTPTLFAAEIGDLDLFRMFVERPGDNPGDPDLTLIEPSGVERCDSMWVAVTYGRHAIVSYLVDRERQRQR